MLLILPLSVTFPLKTKKDRTVKYSLNEFLLDLSDKSWNNARKPNHAYQFKAKKHLQDIVKGQLATMPPLDMTKRKEVILTIFRGNNRGMDVVDNPVVLIKFAMDIVKINHAEDDNWKYFKRSIMQDGGLDRENPRAELLIKDVEDDMDQGDIPKFEEINPDSDELLGNDQNASKQSGEIEPKKGNFC